MPRFLHRTLHRRPTQCFFSRLLTAGAEPVHQPRSSPAHINSQNEIGVDRSPLQGDGSYDWRWGADTCPVDDDLVSSEHIIGSVDCHDVVYVQFWENELDPCSPHGRYHDVRRASIRREKLNPLAVDPPGHSIQVHTHPNILKRGVVIDEMQYDPVVICFLNHVGSNVLASGNRNYLLAGQLVDVNEQLPATWLVPRFVQHRCW